MVRVADGSEGLERFFDGGFDLVCVIGVRLLLLLFIVCVSVPTAHRLRGLLLWCFMFVFSVQYSYEVH